MKKACMLLILCLTLGLYGFSPGCGGEEDKKEVTYFIKSSMAATITGVYYDQNGRHSLFDVGLPYKFSFKAQKGDYYFIQVNGIDYNDFFMQIATISGAKITLGIIATVYVNSRKIAEDGCYCPGNDPNISICEHIEISGNI